MIATASFLPIWITRFETWDYVFSRVLTGKIYDRVVSLVMRLYNSVIMIFEIAPEEYRPTFYIREVEGKWKTEC